MFASKIATPAKSSAEDAGEIPPAAATRAPVADALRWPARAVMLALNFLPLAHGVAVALCATLLPIAWPLRVAAAAGALWLLPPIACRLVLAVAPLEDGTHALGSRAFWSWWISLQLQTIFSRLPFLEELLRIVPSLYSLWMRLWGAHVGRLTYWAPGLEITDRGLLDLGNDCVLGGRSRLGAHILRRDETGAMQLVVGRIRLGHRVVLGAQSTLGPGAQLEDGEVTHAFFLAPPFSRWRGGKRIRESASPSAANQPSQP